MWDEEKDLVGHEYAGLHRCSICNCVSSEAIATNIGDYRKTHFMPDPKNKLFDICIECHESIQDVSDQYIFDEEDEEWVG